MKYISLVYFYKSFFRQLPFICQKIIFMDCKLGGNSDSNISLLNNYNIEQRLIEYGKSK